MHCHYHLIFHFSYYYFTIGGIYLFIYIIIYLNDISNWGRSKHFLVSVQCLVIINEIS